MRHSRIGISALTLVAAATFGGAAQAQQAYNWTGFYAGVYGGYSVAGQATDALNCPGLLQYLTSSNPPTTVESVTLTGIDQSASDFCSNTSSDGGGTRSVIPTSQSAGTSPGLEYNYDPESGYYDYYQSGTSEVDKKLDNLKGWMTGTEAGYLQQSGNFVFGAELSGALTGITDTRDSYEEHGGEGPYYSENGESTTHAQLGIDWLTTATARAGFAKDNLLFTADAGLALAGTTFSASTSGTEYVEGEFPYYTQDYGGSWTDHQTTAGWTAGARVDVGVTDHTSLFLAYNYVSLPGVQYSGQITAPGVPDPEYGLPSTSPATQTFKYDLGLQLIKAGIDFHW